MARDNSFAIPEFICSEGELLAQVVVFQRFTANVVDVAEFVRR